VNVCDAKAKLKAVYTVTELARMAGVDKRQLVRRLEHRGVRLDGGGRGWARVVYLASLRAGMPDLWDSILDREALSG
jgi:hypothetical protein